MALVWTLIISETINRFLTFVKMNCSLNDLVTQEKFGTFLVYDNKMSRKTEFLTLYLPCLTYFELLEHRLLRK